MRACKMQTIWNLILIPIIVCNRLNTGTNYMPFLDFIDIYRKIGYKSIVEWPGHPS